MNDPFKKVEKKVVPKTAPEIPLGHRFSAAILQAMIEAVPLRSKLKEVIRQEFGEPIRDFTIKIDNCDIVIEIPFIANSLKRRWRFTIINPRP